MSSADGIPFLDLAGQHAEIANELDEAWAKVTSTNGFVGGPYVATFEAEYAKYCGTSECIGVANGTDAIELMLRGLGIGPGDEVIVPANTFVATVEAVVDSGAIPVFVDVADDTLLVTADHIAAAITPRTAAAIVVHLYGQMPDMDAISSVTEKAGIVLLEDAAQAQGAAWRDRRAGSWGRAGSFSFYPGKNLGAFGDAGAITTDDVELTNRIRSLGDHGRRLGTKHEHALSGVNSRLDALQAAILSIKLARLDDWNARRRAAADHYRELLAGTDIRVLHTAPERHADLPPGDRAGGGSCGGHGGARCPRDRLGSALPDSMPSTEPLHTLCTRAVQDCRASGSGDPLGSDVPDDHPSRSRTCVRDTDRGRRREPEWNWKLRARLTAPGRRFSRFPKRPSRSRRSNGAACPSRVRSSSGCSPSPPRS